MGLVEGEGTNSVIRRVFPPGKSDLIGGGEGGGKVVVGESLNKRRRSKNLDQAQQTASHQ